MKKFKIKLLTLTILPMVLMSSTTIFASTNNNYQNSDNEIKTVINTYVSRNIDVLKSSKLLNYNDITKNTDLNKYINLDNKFKISLNKGTNTKIKNDIYKINYSKINIINNQATVNLELNQNIDKVRNSKEITSNSDEYHLISLKKYNNKWYIDLDISDSLKNPDSSILNNPNYLKSEIDGVQNALAKINNRINVANSYYDSNLTNRKVRSPRNISPDTRRANAVAYAKQWWNSHNPDYSNYDNDDCTNFVSQCLFYGGMPQDSTWYKDSTSWINVESFANYFTQGGRGNSLEFDLYSSNSNIGVLPFLAKKGDVLQLKYSNSNDYGHTIMVSSISNGDVKYTGHSKARFDASTEDNIISNWEYKALRLIQINY
ncbi:amidase domain-containing protein [Clostridium felsineum]|uniref:Putative amidase domain-containing protein n=1 Tax=Clostridium felsineum TaxID=36839 RepID=A0A1S8LCW8_9CLOT|nr:amidase domain-containing protein [Clostridium felsineum]URZ08951.1 hypothetical protein CLROS_043550 [Clostridium felsineum]URZ09579.1 hypothetical protein CROST_002600 [Clostridium felsineum]